MAGGIPNPVRFALHGQRRFQQTRSACESFAARTFAPLPGTREEVQHIAQLWRQAAQAANPRARMMTVTPEPGQPLQIEAGTKSNQLVMLGDAHATEAAFKQLAQGRRVLHLATHGFFLDRHCAAEPDAETTTAAAAASAVAAGAPAEARSAGAAAVGRQLLEESPLLRSGLVLAGANRRAQIEGDDEDGILTAEEIAGLDLSAAQWAVLSACDTGRGDWQAGEGVLGLRRAFQVAGARTVILSLWPVLDTVASDWMAALYRGRFVDGISTAGAVRAASRTMLAERRKAGQSTHPLYWSGFIATGDWR
jgi:hypothetical protein